MIQTKYMDNCLFCKIVAGDIPAYKVHETDQVLAFLDIGPVSPGHTLVIPKQHAENFTANTPAEAVAIMEAIHVLAPKMMQALGATGYNLGMNHGEVAGQEVMHTHFHIMPRYEGIARSFVKTKPTPAELQAIAKTLQAVI